MPFTMLFEGLICHIGTAEEKTHAVMVNDPFTHIPTLQLNSATPIPLFKGDRLEFDTGAGVARTDATFRDRVPSLQPLIPGGYTIEAKVFNAISDPTDNALAYIIFPKGELDAPEVAYRPIDFDGPDRLFLIKRCVAKGVRFRPDQNATLRIMFSGSARATFTLTDTDVVRIRNVSNGDEGHFQLYRGLTTSPILGEVHADERRRCKPERDFDEGVTLFPDKSEALAAGARQRAALSAELATADRSELKASSPADKPTASPSTDIFAALSVPHAECSNSGWP